MLEYASIYRKYIEGSSYLLQLDIVSAGLKEASESASSVKAKNFYNNPVKGISNNKVKRNNSNAPGKVNVVNKQIFYRKSGMRQTKAEGLFCCQQRT